MFFNKKPNLTLVPRMPVDQAVPLVVPILNGGDDKEVILSTEVLYNTYRQSLLNYLVGMLPGGKQDALEILHETYIRLLRLDNLDRLRENPRAYIFTVATNLVRDFHRRRANRVDIHVDFDEIDFPSDELTPTRALNWDQSLEQLKQSLMCLPEITRRIFVLSRFDDLTYPEIAHTLDISTRTVERHMSVAFKALQHSLEDFL